MMPEAASAWDALDDHEVVRLARAGREAAYRELIRRYQQPIFALIYRMVRDRELAEDLAQDTFVKVLNALATYRAEFKFSSWIFKIASNTAIDHLRRRNVITVSLDGTPHADTSETVGATTPQVATEDETPLARVEAAELGSAIEAAIGRLRPEYRLCVLLRHVEDRSYDEIAEITDLPLGTVKTYIHRGRHELRAMLATFRHDDDDRETRSM